MVANITELCVLLVKDFYGTLHSRVFGILSRYGRLRVPQIAQRSQLAPRSIRGSIAVLLHANLVSHIVGDDSSSLYEANREQAYSLVRMGRILDVVERTCGRHASQLMLHILSHGNFEKDLLQDIPAIHKRTNAAFESEVEHPVNGVVNGSLANGFAKNLSNGSFDTKSSEKKQTPKTNPANPHMCDAIDRLAERGLICQVEVEDVEDDIIIHPRPCRKTSVKMQSLSGSEFRGPNRTNGDDNETSYDHYAETIGEGTNGTKHVNGLKRKAKHRDDQPEIPASKRAKAEAVVSTSDDDTLPAEASSDELPVSNDSDAAPAGPTQRRVVFQANHGNLYVLLRDQALQTLADRTLSKQTSSVFAAILEQTRKQMQSHQARCQENFTQDAQIDTVDLGALLGSHSMTDRVRRENVSSSNAMANGHYLESMKQKERSCSRDNDTLRPGFPHHVSNNHPLTNGLSNGLNSGSYAYPDDQSHTSGLGIEQDEIDQIAYHLEVLAESPYHFVEKLSTGERVHWTVPLELLTRRLRRNEILLLIKTHFGNVAGRLVRLLMDQGKMDERVLQEMALVNTKDLRQILGQLKTAGLLELQEIAREASRNPSRIMYFWFFDEERVRKSILERCLKGMTKCLQRYQNEQAKMEPIIAKAARNEVRGKEELSMEKHEFPRFQRWKQKEECFIGELARLDHLVSVLRDF